MIHWTHRLEIQVQLALDEENWPDIATGIAFGTILSPLERDHRNRRAASPIASANKVVSDSTPPAATQELGEPRPGSTWSRPAAWCLTWSSSAPSDWSQTVTPTMSQEDYADFWVSRFCLTWEDAPW